MSWFSKLFKREPEYVYVPDPHVEELERVLHQAREQIAALEERLAEARQAVLEANNGIEAAVLAATQRGETERSILARRVEYYQAKSEDFAVSVAMLEERIAGLEARIAVQQRFIEDNLRVPAYAVGVGKDDRLDVALRLYREGWSGRKVQRLLFGYSGGAAWRLWQKALAESGTAPVTEAG